MSKSYIIEEYARLENSGRATYTDALKRIVPKLWELLPEQLPKPYNIMTNVMHDIWLVYPYDRELRHSIISLFIDNGWEIKWETKEHEIEDNNKNPKVCFHYNDDFWGTDVITEFNDSLEGSTCSRKEIGKVMKEVPIFEFSCGEEE